MGFGPCSLYLFTDRSILLIIFLATHLGVPPISDDRFIINLQYKNQELDVEEV